MDSSFVQILDSDKVSPQTRAVLEERGRAVEHEYAFFSREEAALMELVAEAVLPQAKLGTAVPCAKMIDMRLSAGAGDGWRFAVLPQDGEAYRLALARLRGELAVAEESSVMNLLARAARTEMDTPDFSISRWFEDMKAEVTKFWMASPETMALMGYQGFADDLLTVADIAPGNGR